MKKTVCLLIGIAIMSKMVGFGRDVVLAYVYGATPVSDAYLISQIIPRTLFSFVGIGLVTGYTPLFSQVISNEGEKEGEVFTSQLINLLLLITGAAAVLGIFWAEPLVRLFASGFEGETLHTAVLFTRISLLGMLFFGLHHVLGGYLRLQGNFAAPALLGFPMNIVVMASMFLSLYYGITILAVGSAVAALAQFLFLVPFVREKGYRHRLVLDLTNPQLQALFAMAVPVMVGITANQLNTVVDKTLASGLAVGGISALNYSYRLILFVQGLFGTSITTVMYPTISRLAAEGSRVELKGAVQEAINALILLTVPASVGALVFAEPIVRLLFGRGAFDERAALMTAAGLFFYSLGMLPYGLRGLLSKAFYSLQDTKTPMKNAVIGVSLNIVLNVILSRYMGLAGLALATSMAVTVTACLLLFSLQQKIGSLDLPGLGRLLIKIGGASLVMVAAAYGLYRYLMACGFTASLALLPAIGSGVLLYGVLVMVMGIKEVESLKKAVKLRFKNREERFSGEDPLD